jgi:hypothetical protein
VIAHARQQTAPVPSDDLLDDPERAQIAVTRTSARGAGSAAPRIPEGAGTAGRSRQATLPQPRSRALLFDCLALALSAGALATFVFMLRLHWPFTIDDAFITFRYSRNLASGHGAVYNPGEVAEGYTSFLWMILMTVPHLLHADAVLWSKIFGILAALGVAGLVFLYTVRLTRSRLGARSVLAGAIAAFVLLTGPPFATHVVSGMETVLYTLLATAFFGAATTLEAESSRQTTRLAVLGLLTALTRPEGAIAVGVVFIGLLWRLRATNWKALCRSFLFAFVIPAAIYWAWRWWYYGLLFPLPFYVKMGFDSGVSGIHDVLDFLRYIAPRLGPWVILGSMAVGRRGLPALGACVTLTVFFLFLKPWMGYDWRYLYPLYPWLVVLSVTGLTAALDRLLLRSGSVSRRSLMVDLCTVAAYLASTYWIGTGLWPRNYRGGLQWKLSYATFVSRAYVPLAQYMARVPEASRPRLLAITDAGAVPYYSGWRTLDLVGLNEAVIGRSGKHDPAYVLSQRPDVVFLNSFDATTFSGRGAWVQDLYEALAKDGFVKLAGLPFRQDYHVWILGKPSEPVVASFIAGLQQAPGRAEH